MNSCSCIFPKRVTTDATGNDNNVTLRCLECGENTGDIPVSFASIFGVSEEVLRDCVNEESRITLLIESDVVLSSSEQATVEE